jgi:transcription antitermination factor NusG
VPLAALCMRHYPDNSNGQFLFSLSPLKYCPYNRNNAYDQGSSCRCDPEGEATNTHNQLSRSEGAALMVNHEQAKWYAVQTRARNEKAIATRFEEQGLTTFLPLVTEVRRWSDRKKEVVTPLFSCYVFVQLVASNYDARIRVCRTDGVFRIVSMRGEAIPIPDEQIESLRTVVTQQVSWSEHSFLEIGQRVRIRDGCLQGVEGVLLAHNSDRTLIISVDAIQRSLAVRVEGYDVEPL